MQQLEREQWARFHADRDPRAREWLILHYRPLVEQVIRRFKGVRPDDREDLRGAGLYGLVRAVDEWRPEGMPWLEYAKFKIRCAAIDQIRAVSWVPKGIRSQAEQLDRSEAQLAARLGRKPTTEERAAALNCSPEEYERTVAAVRATEWGVLSLEGSTEADWARWEAVADPDAADPEEETLRRQQLDELELVLQQLPGVHRQLLRWLYFDEPRVNQKTIAARLGVHESRVSQLMEDAIRRARKLALYERTLLDEVFAASPRLTRRD